MKTGQVNHQNDPVNHSQHLMFTETGAVGVAASPWSMIRAVSVADPGFWKGGFFYRLSKAAAQRCVLPISPREVRKFFSPLFFSYQGGFSWHLRALHSKFQM